jgi:hypothetical protein
VIKPTSCETCGGYCLNCGRYGSYPRSGTEGLFLFITPYIIVFFVGALIGTLFFKWWIPGSYHANAALAAVGACRQAADDCRDACEGNK